MISLNGIEINAQFTMLVLVALVIIPSPLVDSGLQYLGNKLFKKR